MMCNELEKIKELNANGQDVTHIARKKKRIRRFETAESCSINNGI